jgi:hypothetical protein
MKSALQALFASALLLGGGSSANAGYTIDTNPSYFGQVNSGWLSSGQSLTVVSGYEIFDDIGFYFDSQSHGRTFGFVLSDALTGGATLYSTSFTVNAAGINVINIGLQLTAGQKVYALLDYNGFSGFTAHIIENDVYAGGNSNFGQIPFLPRQEFPDWEHRFVANFSGTNQNVVPGPSGLVLAGMAGLTFTGFFGLRRRKQPATP